MDHNECQKEKQIGLWDILGTVITGVFILITATAGFAGATASVVSSWAWWHMSSTQHAPLYEKVPGLFILCILIATITATVVALASIALE